MEFLLITGLSGAGKSQAKYALEDLGFFCVDNLPPALIPEFADYMENNSEAYPRAAFAVDIRGGKFFGDLEPSLKKLKERGHTTKILFLEASDETLIKRFKENRRVHPLGKEVSYRDALASERAVLERLRRDSDWIINTDDTTNSQLRIKIADAIGISAVDNFFVTLTSFGYKYGLVREADFVFDLRYLPNPYYDKDLKHLSGNEKAVRDYVMNSEKSHRIFDAIKALVLDALPMIIEDGRRSANIAFGCTGGRQRSVTFVNLFKTELEKAGYKVGVAHRDLEE